MQKITVNDFSGGIQEATAPDDFTDRQWAQLKGVVSTSETLFETQWAIQSIGTETGFHAVWPLQSSAGTFLVGLKTNGEVWWCMAPGGSSAYTTANSTTWTKLTTASNVGWASGDSTTQPAITVQRNPNYHFLCSVPVEVPKYARSPKTGDKDNINADEDLTTISKGVSSGVLINTSDRISNPTGGNKSRAAGVATIDMILGHGFSVGDRVYVNLVNDSSYNGWVTLTGRTNTSISYANAGPDEAPTATAGRITLLSQALVAYVETSDLSVKVLTFPNVRRLPTHTTEGGFINANYLDATGVQQTATMPTWPELVFPSVSRHPYTYVDKNGTLLPGTGIIPEANVGTVKGTTLVVGDIQWRTKFGTAAEIKESAYCTTASGSRDFDVFGTSLNLPVEDPAFPVTSRVLFNEGPGIVYLKDDAAVTAEVISKAATGGVATLKTVGNHGFTVGEKVEIFGIEGRFDGIYTLETGTSGDTIVYNIASSDTVSTTVLVSKISAKSISGTTATVKTSVAHGITGPTAAAQISNAGFPWDTISTTVTVVDATTLTYTLAAAPGDVAELSVTTDRSAYPRAASYNYRVEVGAYQTIPDVGWSTIFAAASASTTRIKASRNLNVASHLLNDDNTGPFRGGIYFSAGELDTFDSRAVLLPAKTDVRVAGIHVLDDTIIVITQKGSAEDGVIRIRGYLSRLISYSGVSDPNAIRIELVRGGIGAPQASSQKHRSYSCVWPEAGVVVFIDAGGGVYYTNGQACDRLDRYGPKPPIPSDVTDLDHVAAMGRSLLVYRATGASGRLLCFTIMSSDGAGGSGCWTELNIPGQINNMVGSEDAVYWVHGGRIQRLNPSAPIAERGRIDNVPTTVTVGTRTFGEVGSHRRTTWQRFGMTFNTPTSCTVQDVKIQSTGVLNAQGTISAPDVQYSRTLNRTYSDPGILGEFTIPAGIGPQAVASATVTFQGYVQLQSASFWVSGTDPRSGDK